MVAVWLICVQIAVNSNYIRAESILDICRRRRRHSPLRILLSCGEILDVGTF